MIQMRIKCEIFHLFDFIPFHRKFNQQDISVTEFCTFLNLVFGILIETF